MMSNQQTNSTSQEVEFYDADEQKYLNQQKLTRNELIWLKIKHALDLASADPNGKGVYMQQLIGKGDKSITQEVYLDHPHNGFYYATQALEVLLSPEILQHKTFRSKLDKIKEAMHRKNKALLEEAKLKKKEDKFVFDFVMTKAFCSMLIVLIDEFYGREIPLIDTIEPRNYTSTDINSFLNVSRIKKFKDEKEENKQNVEKREPVNNQEEVKEE